MPCARPLMSIVFLALAASRAAAQAPTGGELLWSFQTSTSSADVALGDRGTQVLAITDNYDLELFSAFDQNPPTALWSGSFSVAMQEIASADERDVYLRPYLAITGTTTSVGTLSKHTSSALAPVWSYTYPEQFFSVPVYDLSADGETIVSAFTDSSLNRIDFVVHDPDTGLAAASWNQSLAIPAERVEVSPDGSVVVHSGTKGMGGLNVIDLASQQSVFVAPGSMKLGPSIATGGQALVAVERIPPVEWHARIFVRQGATYVERLDLVTPDSVYLDFAAISADGSVAVFGWGHSDPYSRLILRAFDVASGAMTMQRVFDGQGGLVNLWADVDISADGSRFAVGMLGDQAKTLAEVAVYAPDQDLPIAEFPDRASVRDLDLSADGRRLTAIRSNSHVNGGYDKLFVELYRVGQADFEVSGVPSIGNTIVFDVHGAPGASAFLLGSIGLASAPVSYPGIGMLQLDRSGIGVTAIGPIPASGVASFPYPISSSPTLIGVTFYYQGYTAGPAQLTEDWEAVTFLP